MQKHGEEGPLVGPQSDERIPEKLEDVAGDGQPIYFALIPEDAYNLTNEEVEDAKNAIKKMPAEVIEMYQRVPLAECRKIIEEHSHAA